MYVLACNLVALPLGCKLVVLGSIPGPNKRGKKDLAPSCPHQPTQLYNGYLASKLG